MHELWKEQAPEDYAKVISEEEKKPRTQRIQPHVAWCLIWHSDPKSQLWLGMNSLFYQDWSWFFINYGSFDMKNYRDTIDLQKWLSGSDL